MASSFSVATPYGFCPDLASGDEDAGKVLKPLNEGFFKAQASLPLPPDHFQDTLFKKYQSKKLCHPHK